MIRESRAVSICIVLALAMVAFDVSVLRLERRTREVHAFTAIDAPGVTVYLDTTTCPWWIPAETWWNDDCPTGKAPALPVPEGLR